MILIKFVLLAQHHLLKVVKQQKTANLVNILQMINVNHVLLALFAIIMLIKNTQFIPKMMEVHNALLATIVPQVQQQPQQLNVLLALTV